MGTVNPGQLTSLNLNTRGGLNRQKTITANLIAATTCELPAIQFWDYVDVQFVSNKGFNDWPIGNNAQLNLPSTCG